MATKKSTAATLSSGVVHELAPDVAAALSADEGAAATWQDITPLARNEWLCWVEDAKQAQTRQRRIERAVENLAEGKRRPCCWPGCSHREKTGS